jgi:hypothetical protein
MPMPAELPDGFGTTFTGALLFVFDPLAEGFGVALGVIFGIAFGVALTLGEGFPSTTVTLIFCPGNKFSIFIAPFDLSVPVLGGLIARGFFVGFGVGVDEDFGLGLAGEDGIGEGFGVGFGVGLTEGVGDGVGFTVGTGVGAGLAESSGSGLGLVEGSGFGAGVGAGVGAGATGEVPPETGALGAGELGAEEIFAPCSGVIGSEGRDGEDSPTDVTVVTVNVYGSPFVSDPKRIGEEVTVLVSPVSTIVTMYPVIAAPLPVAPLNSRFTLLFPGVPVTTVGAFGVPAGVPTIPFELAPRPTPFSAATVNV